MYPNNMNHTFQLEAEQENTKMLIGKFWENKVNFFLMNIDIPSWRREPLIITDNIKEIFHEIRLF